MKRLSIVLAIGVLLLSVGFTAVPAQAGLAFEDPQMCVEGKLLEVVAPPQAVIVVHVDPNLSVNNTNVALCGGDQTLAFADNQIIKDGKKNSAEVQVSGLDKKDPVTFKFNGKSQTKKADNQGEVEYKVKVK